MSDERKTRPADKLQYQDAGMVDTSNAGTGNLLCAECAELERDLVAANARADAHFRAYQNACRETTSMTSLYDAILAVPCKCGERSLNEAGIWSQLVDTKRGLAIARSEERERCAKVCEESAKQPSTLWEEVGCWSHASSCCAEAIRSLTDEDGK